MAGRVVITCHISPDGDAMGSSLGLCKALRNAGKEVKVITPDTPPKYLMFLPGAENIVVFTRHELYAKNLLANADLIFCLDYNDSKRIDLVAPALLASRAQKVMIDHHLYPDTFPDLVISHPEISSTSVLVYRVLSAIGLLRFVDIDVATALYTGMMTDTGNFSYNSNDPELYRVVARLLEKGIDKDGIYKRVYFTNSVNRLRLNGFALCENLVHYPDHRAALITLTRDELNRYHYQKGDTEDLVNRPLTCPDITYSVFLREETDYIKVSTRSKGDFPVNKLCQEYFNGGGHLNAAGGEFYGTLQEAVDRLLEAMPEFDRYLPQPN
jgi:phosphoesterase RecJ-like protein